MLFALSSNANNVLQFSYRTIS